MLNQINVSIRKEAGRETAIQNQMAYYCLVRNNVVCFIRNIIHRRNGYAKQDCFGYKSHLDFTSDNELLSGICYKSERYSYCTYCLPFIYTHVYVGDIYLELELYS